LVKLAIRYALTVPFGMAAALLALFAALPGAATAGPWLQKPGGYFVKAAFSYLYAESEFDHGGDEVPVLTSNPLVRSAAYREIVLNTYVEYGLDERATLVGSLPFKILTSRRTEITDLADLIREVDVTNAGFSDLHIGVRSPLLRGRHPVSGEVRVKVPLGYPKRPANSGPALGSAEVDVTASILAGTTLRGAYATASAAYRVRGGSLADDVGFSLQVGGARRRLSGQALVEGWYSTVDPAPLDESSTARAANQDVLKVIGTLGYRTAERATVAVEAYHILSGKNAATGTTVAAALILTR
jgi:hypothetical protein